MKKKSLVVTMASVAAIAAIGIGSTFAYFTSQDEATNAFTLGDIEIDLTEENWDEDNGVNILPMQTIAKDPAVTNTGSNDAYIFLKVIIPQAEVQLEGQDEASVQDLFTFEANDGWTLISSENGEYVYAYDNVVAAGESTDTLFDEVQLVNLIEDDYAEVIESLDIDVLAYGVQTVSFDSAADAWEATFAE